MNDKDKEGKGKEKLGSGPTAGDLKAKAIKLRNELVKAKQQQISKQVGPDRDGGKANKPLAIGGKGPAGGERIGQGGTQGKPKLVGLGLGNGKEVGAKGVGNSTGAARASVTAHYNGLTKVIAKNPQAIDNIRKAAEDRRTVFLDENHYRSLGVSVPKIRPGKQSHKTSAFVYATGTYAKRVPAFTQEMADAHNKMVDEFNEKLEDAKASVKKNSVSSKFVLSFPTTWEELVKSKLNCDPAKTAEQLAIERQGGECDHPITAIRPMEYRDPTPEHMQTVNKQSYAVGGAMTDVGVAHTFKASSQHERTEPQYDEASKSIIGSELLAPIKVDAGANVPEGGNLTTPLPANPRFIDSTRCTQLLEMFAQFRIDYLVYEYFASCPSTTEGANEMVFVDDSTDTFVTESGFGAERDGYTRPGNAEAQVWELMRCELHFPQQLWYYTGGQNVPGLEIPGMIEVLSMLGVQNLGGENAINFGFLSMHYKFAVRSASIPGKNGLAFFTASKSLDMSGATITVNTPVRVTPAASTFPTNLTAIGVVYSALIGTVTDPAGGDQSWRQWIPGEDGAATNGGLILGPEATNAIFWRCHYVNGVQNLVFYPTFGDAISSASYEQGGRTYIATASSVAAAKSFILYGIQGTLQAGEV